MPRKHLTCVVGFLGVSVLFGDSGSDRLGSGGGRGRDLGGGRGLGGGGGGGASDCLSHGFLGRVAIVAIVAAADNAG